MRHSRTKSFAASATLFAAALYAGPAAPQQAYTTFECRAGTLAWIARGDDAATIFGIDHRGVQQSTHESKLFHNWTQRCVGSVGNIGGKFAGGGYCKNVDPASGDFVVVHWTADEKRPNAGIYSLVHGTGKLKGISGGGTYEPSGTFRPVEDGTYQNCINVKGTALIPSKQ